MNAKGKRIGGLLMALCLLFGIFPITAYAEGYTKVNVTGNQNFSTVEGYSQQSSRTFSLTFEGITEPITGISASFTTGNSSCFEITEGLSSDTLTSTNNTLTISVRPKTGIPAGDYYSALYITGDDTMTDIALILHLIVTANTFSCTISPNSCTFPNEITDYNNTAMAQEFTLTNTGAEQLTSLTAALQSGENFELSTGLSTNTVDEGNTATVSVRPKSGLAAGTYTDSLEIKGDNGIEKSVSLSFTVSDALAAAPTFTTMPSSQSINANGSTTFTAVANGDPAPTYQWYESTNGIYWNIIKDGGIYSGATTGTLTLTSVPSDHNGYQYQCIASNSIDADFSTPATLTVTRISTMALGGQTGVSLAANAHGTGWDWNSSSMTLTLDSSYGGDAIKIQCESDDNINLVLAGDVTISSIFNSISVVGVESDNVGGNLTIKAGSYTLNVSSSIAQGLVADSGVVIESGTVVASTYSGGIASYYGSVTISGSADVTLAGGTMGNGIQAKGNVIISTSGSVTAIGSVCGIYAIDGGITISSGTVKADGGRYEALGVGENGVGVNITGGTVITGDVSGANGDVYSDLTVSGAAANVTVNGAVDGNLNVSDGTVKITGEVTGITKHTGGILNLVAADGSQAYAITVTNGTAAPSAAVKDGSVTLTANAAPDGQRFKQWTVVSGEVTLQNPLAQTTIFTMPANAVEVRADYEVIPIPVTGISLNKTSLALYSNKSTRTAQLTASVTPSNATDQTVTWSSGNTSVATVDANGTVTAVGNGTATITATTNDSGYTTSCTVTVTTYTSSGTSSNGGGSSSSSSGGSVTTTPASPTVSGTTATTVVTPSISGGIATGSVTESQMNSALKAANEAAAKAGEAPRVEIKVSEASGASSVRAAIPGASLQSLGDSGSGLTVSSDLGSVTFDTDAIGTISDAGSGDLTVSIVKAEDASLSDDARAQIGSRPVYQFSVTRDGSTISEFGGTAAVSVLYVPAEDENLNAIIMWYVGADGTLTLIPNSQYDSATGMVNFTTTHFSMYAVGYHKADFADVADSAWYADAVTFLAARDITSGTTDTTFSPDATLTRGQFITLLMRAYGIAAEENPTDNFSDAGNTYYTGYLASAKELGITNGVGDNKFEPDQVITRQDLFTLLYNALNVIDALPEGDSGTTLTDFTDEGDVAYYAQEAMAYLTETGIIVGSNGYLSPQATATRAQTAQVLYHLIG